MSEWVEGIVWPRGVVERFAVFLQRVFWILSVQDSHDFYGVPVDSVVDGVYAANAAPVAFANIVNGSAEQWLLCQFTKALYQIVLIFSRLFESEGIDSEIKDVVEVFVRTSR